MKIIAMLGDSHTWGEGVGAEAALHPGVVGGDLRMTPFTYPGYVNLLRERVNAATGSSAREYGTAALAALGGREADDRSAAVFDTGRMTFTAEFSYARLFVRVCEAEPLLLHLALDGQDLPDVTLSPASDRWNVGLFPVHLHADDGTHTVTVRADAGRLVLFRLECYSGTYAVVNCGVGSCPVAKYLDLYYDRYITPMHPFGVLFEGCTINDWITGEGTQVYGDHVRVLLDRLTADRLCVVCHTVFPIAGEQTFGACAVPYPAYVDAMRSAVLEAELPLVDLYASLREKLDRMPKEERGPWLYHDVWHPNATGHALYAEEIYPVLAHVMGINA